MAIRDRIAKALNLPVGAVTQTEQQIAAQVPASGTLSAPLERDPANYMVPFAPGRPLIPALINPPREDGRSAPRRSEFPVAWNLQVTEQRVIPFRLLRDVADGSDIVRKCVEVVKASIAGMEWDINLSPEATERVQAETKGIGTIAAARAAREELMPEISRCKDFWAMPDRINGLAFAEWSAMAIEEMLVVDALSIYPNKTLDEENLHSLEILDGTTIKPLLDDRGARPVPPYPAFQQILWGFPRGEFTASADADGEFTADDLIYAPRTRRPFTPYGYSAVERALPMIDLYMKRLQWLRTEFTDGVTPDVFLLTDATYGDNPELLRAYERVMNDDLAGKSEQRRRARMLPDGISPIFPPGMDAKYRSDFDEYIVKQIAGHFGVMPTQIGFAPKGGLGGAGIQQGESETSDIIGMQPIVLWFTDLLNQLSYRFLGMPRDLVFTLANATADDDNLDAQRIQTQIISGQLTLNEARSEMGLPLFTFPEADMPMVPNNIMPLADVEEVLAGILVPADESAPAASADAQTEGEAGTGDMTEPDKSVNPVSIELAAFAKWTKGARKREFVFEFLDSFNGKSLNALAQHDPIAARDLAKTLKEKNAKQGSSPVVMAGSEKGRGVNYFVSGEVPQFTWSR